MLSIGSSYFNEKDKQEKVASGSGEGQDMQSDITGEILLGIGGTIAILFVFVTARVIFVCCKHFSNKKKFDNLKESVSEYAGNLHGTNSDKRQEEGFGNCVCCERKHIGPAIHRADVLY